MLIAILILVCFLFFFSLLILGELFLIKKKSNSTKTVPRLPTITKDMLTIVTREMKRAVNKDASLELYARWMGELGGENPILAVFIQVLDERTTPQIAALGVYVVLKAQAEADSLADLTKIQR